MTTTPLPGELYRHRKGGIYVVVCIASEEATERPVVVYRSQQDGRHWTRPLEEFMDGRFEQVPEPSRSTPALRNPYSGETTPRDPYDVD